MKKNSSTEMRRRNFCKGVAAASVISVFGVSTIAAGVDKAIKGSAE